MRPAPYLVPTKPLHAPPVTPGVPVRPRWWLGATIAGRHREALVTMVLPTLPVLQPVLGPVRPPASLADPGYGARHWLRAFWQPGAPPRPPLLLDWFPWAQVRPSRQVWWAVQQQPLWLTPPMQSHTLPTLPLARFADQSVLSLLPAGSGMVLDTRHLAYLGLPIPLPDVVAEALRPAIVAVGFADVPTRAEREAEGWPSVGEPHLRREWRPGTSARWSAARWRAMAQQWQDVPALVPSLQTARWLEGLTDDPHGP